MELMSLYNRALANSCEKGVVWKDKQGRCHPMKDQQRNYMTEANSIGYRVLFQEQVKVPIE